MLLNHHSFLSFTTYRRVRTKQINVGNVSIGGSAPIRIQTMTNTATTNVNETFHQIKLLYESGAELVRIAVPSLSDVEAIRQIMLRLKQENISIPVIADVHFNPIIAERVAPFVSKVRINPGNYVNRSISQQKKEYSPCEIESEKEQIRSKFIPLIKICKQYGTAIRIGINFASLPWRIVNEYGNTPKAMIASALEFFEICRSENFQQLIFSFKASDVRQTIYANRLYVKEMLEHYDEVYPLHVGITEAGMDLEGTIKSIIGIGTLLHDGIGDTIRVSLTGNPIKEIPVATNIIKLLQHNTHQKFLSQPYFHNPFTYDKRKKLPDSVTSIRWGVCLAGEPLPFNNSEEVFFVHADENYYALRSRLLPLLNNSKPIMFLVNATQTNHYEAFALNIGNLLAEGLIEGVYVQTNEENREYWHQILQTVLQESGAYRVSNEYISCPSCARTLFDIETVAKQVKDATKHIKGYKIAVMGCIVNGPGEMHDADFGIVGAGQNKANLYKQGKLIAQNLLISDAIEQMLQLIYENSHRSHR